MSTAVVNTDSDSLEPTLQSILDQRTLRWIFVGGKGGVGKTTTSCSLAIQLAKVRRSVLLISTDPAHNLSDAFSQKFGKEARLVNGFTNLSAMEIDPNGSIQELLGQAEEGEGPAAGMGGMMQDLAFAIPGIDEAMSFAEVLKQVKSISYETIIFDTAPTGHTLRFLQFPTVLEKALAKISQLSTQFGPMLNGLLGANGALPNGQNLNEMMEKLEGLRETISEVNTQFKDENLTTFVCVCIPEFLSLYETERMIQELSSYHIDTHCIVVNQLLFPKAGSECEQCNARRKMQKKYLEQIEELYDEFNVVKMPLLVEEVRGKERLEKFSEMLITPYVPPSGALRLRTPGFTHTKSGELNWRFELSAEDLSVLDDVFSGDQYPQGWRMRVQDSSDPMCSNPVASMSSEMMDMGLLPTSHPNSTSRSSNGCWTCRLRRKKCDELRPICGICATLHISCHYGLDKPAWMDGGVSQEEMAERLKREVRENAHRYRGPHALHNYGGRTTVAEGTIGESMVRPRNPAVPVRNSTEAIPDVQEIGMEACPKALTIRPQRGADCTLTSKNNPEIEFGRSDTILLMFYLEHLPPFLFPFYRPSLLQGANHGSWK
ncbi:ATPase get3 [Hyphodiscus hymeniophilus]|uniref:ATPase get3 n=1 Tax=Hyphodiscus hymeniophilus TaxID=353542 RepID=A0A9P6VQU8_9HELO|nr:ATPase get3 [Hyphodiscus hymeniophilus]